MNFTIVYSKFDIVVLRLTLMLFKLFGGIPFKWDLAYRPRKINNKKQRIARFSTSSIGSVYNIILSLGLFFFIYIFIVEYKFFASAKLKDHLFIIGLYACRNIFGASIIMNYVIRQKDMVIIANQLMTIDMDVVVKFSDRCFRKSVKCQQLFILLLIVIIYISTCFTELLMTLRLPIHTLLSISVLVMSLSMIQYAFLLIYLKQIFGSVNKWFELLSNRSKSHAIIEDICYIRQLHRKLYEITCKVADIYSLSSTLYITCACIALIYCAYNIIKQTLMTTILASFMGFWLLWFLQYSTIIIVVTTVTTRLAAEVCIKLFNN